MWNQIKKMASDKTLLVGALSAGTLYFNNERNLRLSQSIHDKDYNLEVKKLELQEEQFEFEKSKYSFILNSESIVSSKVNDGQNSNSIISSNPLNFTSETKGVKSSFSTSLNSVNDTLPNLTNVDPTVIPSSLEPLNILSSGILQSSSIIYSLFSISTLIATINLFILYKMNEYGDTFEDKIPKWAKGVFQLWKPFLKNDTMSNFYSIILAQLLTLLLAIYLFFRGIY
jgi:hypothetical protein